MNQDNYRLIRQKFERLLQQETEQREAPSNGFQLVWQRLQNAWNGAIASFTQSRVFNQPSQANQSDDFGYWYNFSRQSWVHSRLEDHPEERRGWLEQAYRHSKSDR